MLGMCTCASADILSSNLDNSHDNAWSTGWDLAMSITTDGSASSSTIRTLYASVSWSGEEGGASDTVWSFYTDNAGDPGTKVAGTDMTIHSFDSDTDLIAYSNSGFSLSDNTTYWAVADSSTTDSAQIDVTDDASQTGWAIGDDTKYRSYDSTGTWNNWGSSSLQIELNSSAVPEPTIVALVALFGLGGMFVRRRFRR